MQREITEPTINAHGDEEHPSFGVVRLSRISSTPGARLFDSSLAHRSYVQMSITRATRHRDIHHDWIHGNLDPLIEVNMTLSQWGALVSSFNEGAGTPVTITSVAGERMPGAAHASRLAETARDVRDAAEKSTESVREAALALVDAFNRKAGRRETGDLIDTLSNRVQNLPSNMKYAADTLTRHAEDVVAKARVDIEAARQFGTQPSIGGAGAAVGELEA